METRKARHLALTLMVILIWPGFVQASVWQSGLKLHADSAPNVYGSPDWGPWWAATKTDVVAGSFTNMRTGNYPGTQDMSPYDEIVYSTGDLGKRLHWVYWLPGTSKAFLDGLFQVKWVIDWGGDDLTLEGGGWAADGAEVGWSQPGSWEDYADGVIGSFGFAWWATDNYAPPLDSYGNPYDETNQADIDALADMVRLAQTHATGLVRYRSDETDDWTLGPSIRLNMVPEPGTLALVGLGLAGLGFRARRKKQS